MLKNAQNTILLVIDPTALRRVIGAKFTEWGYTVFAACNAAEALTIAQHQMPHTVICDQTLPDMSGSSLCDRLCRLYRQTPPDCIVLTEPEQAAPYTRPKHHYNYLARPFSCRQLRSLVEQIPVAV